MAAGRKIIDTSRAFAAQTSIRGLPRIVKNEDRFLKTTWTIFTLLCFCALIYFIYSLVAQYRRYTTAEKVHEYPALDGEFPALSICYELPLFQHFDSEGDDPLGFAKKIDSIIMNLVDHVSNQSTELTVQEVQELDSISYYMETNYDKILQRMKSIKNLDKMVTCTFSNKGKNELCEIETYPKPQSKKGYHLHLNTNFFHCFKFSVPEEAAKSYTSMTITLDLAVSSAHWAKRNDWFRADRETHVMGYGESVMMLLHNRKDSPRVKEYGTRVMLNSQVQMTYKKTLQKYLSVPSSPCKGNKVNGDVYSRPRCREIFYNELMQKECSCISGASPFAIELEETKSVPFCHNLTRVWHHPNNLVAMNNCQSKFDEKFERLLKKRCPRECTHNRFQMETLLTSPITEQTRNLAENVKGQLEQASKVQDLFGMLSAGSGDDAASGNTTETVRRRRIRRSAEVKEKLKGVFESPDGTVGPDDPNRRQLLMQLKRFPTDHDFMSEESLVITKSRLLSQMGGMCSLFAGLTFTVIAELTEVLYLAFFKKKEKQELPPSLRKGDEDAGAPENGTEMEKMNA